MIRWRINLAYDGTEFHGWAAQPGLRTVEQTLAEALIRVVRLGEPPRIVVAGRTDAGVHARGQACHVELPTDREFLRALRAVLPADISVRSLAPAPAGFDARFSAIWRRYCYRLIEADAPPDPLLRGHVAAVRHGLDVEAINDAAAELVGLRDFAAFCKAREGATTIRDLRELQATRTKHGVVEIHLLADAFCHSMVRSLVGALCQVASGRRSRSWLAQTAASQQRQGQFRVMPAHGLTLEEVGYPPKDQLAQRAQESRAMRSLKHP